MQVGVRPAAIRDYWAIAEVHAQSFYPSANWLFAQLLRLDRVFALQVMQSSHQSTDLGLRPLVCRHVPPVLDVQIMHLWFGGTQTIVSSASLSTAL